MSHGDAALPGSHYVAPVRNIAHQGTALRGAVILAPLMVAVAACSGSDRPTATSPYDAAEDLSFGPAAAEQDATVDPTEPLTVTATDDDARITDVTATDASGRTLQGELASDGTRWSSTGPLAADIDYTVEVATENSSGQPGRGTHSFVTGDADAETLDIEFGPDEGTYGVGQPITAELSEEVEEQDERAAVERGLTVTSEPAVEGSWYWVDGSTLHYRPQEYWPAQATVEVASELAGVHVRDGVRGGSAESLTLQTGDRIEALADIGSYTLTVSRNGEEVRSMPMTTGKEGFRTRNGKKVILGKEQHVRMRGDTIGIAPGSSDYYDLDVYWAARVTWSGEYVHGAPWSASSHGSANVSHGCTGLSTENARWLFEYVREGDVIEYVNGDGADMDHFGNGFGDWNLSWEEWQAGSALTEDTGGGRVDASSGQADGVEADAGETEEAEEVPDAGVDGAGAPGRLRPQW